MTAGSIDALLDRLEQAGDAATAVEAARALVAAVLELHGEGLARVLEVVDATSADPGPVLRALAGDDLVAALLVLHGLHPAAPPGGPAPAAVGRAEPPSPVPVRLLPTRGSVPAAPDPSPAAASPAVASSAPAPSPAPVASPAVASFAPVASPSPARAPSSPAPAAAVEPAVARCELCGAAIAAGGHRHVAEVGARRVACACPPCHLLMSPDGAAAGRYRAVPDRPPTPVPGVTGAVLDALDVPVGVAFFVRHAGSPSVSACYPGPAGLAETAIPPERWAGVAAVAPEVAAMEPEVEALLVNGPQAWLVGVDVCYRLAGTLRSGAPAEEFFASLEVRA